MDVPIVGFYTFAPYLVVLVHFNLLLQLQLLSHGLFAFAAAVPQEETPAGCATACILPVHRFPRRKTEPSDAAACGSDGLNYHDVATVRYTHRPAVLVSAYQSEAVTWLQRIAIWIDIVVVVIFWPIILHPKGDWQAYWREILTVLIPRRRVWIAYGVHLLGQVLFSFTVAIGKEDDHVVVKSVSFIIGYAFLLLSPPALIMLYGWKSVSRFRKLYFALLFLLVIGIMVASIGLKQDGLNAAAVFGLKQDGLNVAAVFAVPWLLVPLAMFWHPKSPRGSLALLLMIYIGPLLSLALHVDGEQTERIILRVQGGTDGVTLLSHFLDKRRSLDLKELVLLAKPASPETLTFARSGEGEKALRQVEPINVNHRRLRHANMSETVLIGAYLREVDFQDSYLGFAHLQGASLYRASLQGAGLRNADLQNTILEEADFQSAYLGVRPSSGCIYAGSRSAGCRHERSPASRCDFVEGPSSGFDFVEGPSSGGRPAGSRSSGGRPAGSRPSRCRLEGSQTHGRRLEQGKSLWNKH